MYYAGPHITTLTITHMFWIAERIHQGNDHPNQEQMFFLKSFKGQSQILSPGKKLFMLILYILRTFKYKLDWSRLSQAKRT